MTALAVAVLVTLAAVLAACGGSDGGGASGDTDSAQAASEPLVVATGTNPPSPAQGVYSSVPAAMGYWEEEGLEVKLQPVNGTVPILQGLSTGNFDAGVAGAASLFPAVARGQEVVAFYNHNSGPIVLVAVPSSSDIRTTSDLVGKKIGVPDLESAVVPTLKAYIQRGGGDPEEVDMVNVGTGGPATQALKSGKVDAFVGTDSMMGQIRNQGVELRMIPDEVVYAARFQTAAFTLRETLKTRREDLIAFGRGVVKGTLFAKHNPECAVKLNWEVFPASKPTGVPEDEALKQGLLILNTRQEGTVPVEGQWGMATREFITSTHKVLELSGELAQPVAVEEVWTPELIQAINDFDQEKVIKEAKAYTC